VSLRIAHRVDAPRDCRLPLLDAAGRKVGDAEIAQRINPNTGALEFRAPLTWTGVRPYHHADGTVTRELRRPEQVRSASHLRGLRLLTATSGHPALPDGTPVYLDARGGPGVRSPDGSALRPASDYSIGHIGDTIEDGEIDGYYVPVGWCAITRLASQRGIASGKTQTSLGYTELLDDTPGVWDGPHGPEEYDIEHLLDHEDPRVKQAVADGVVPTVEIMIDGVLRKVPVLGPNHYAAEIWAGRGEAQSEILDFAGPATEMPRRTADDAAVPRQRGAYATVVADAAPVAADEAVQRAARTARVDAVSIGRLAPELASALSVTPLSGRYGVRTEPCVACGATSANPACETCSAASTPVGEWLGWIVPAAGRPGEGGIAFVAPDGLGLWWAQRDPQGGVVGLPSAFAWRDPAEVSAAAPARPVATATDPVAPTDDVQRSRGADVDADKIEDAPASAGETADALVNAAKIDAFLSSPKVAELRIEYAESNLECRVSIDGRAGVTISPTPDEWLDVLASARHLAVPADDLGNLPPITDAADATARADAPSEHAARQADPDKFNAFLRFEMPNGASLILGRFGGGPWQVQSARFPADKWTPAKAQKWLKSAGLVATQFETAVKSKTDAIDTEDDNDAVSFVARDACAPYALDVRGPVAGARSLPMRKIHLPARLADAAGALATAVKAPSPVPVKVADSAMLEVDLPEGADPVMLAAGLQALTDALVKMTGDMAGLEASAASLGEDFAAAAKENDELKTKVDALTADAEVGKAHRLAEVVAVAKKVGLTDADVTGLDADAVRVAAVSKRYPATSKHLDQKPVLDSMWIAIVDAASAPAPTAKPVVTPAGKSPELRPAPARHADGAGDVDGHVPPVTPKIALVTHDYG